MVQQDTSSLQGANTNKQGPLGDFNRQLKEISEKAPKTGTFRAAFAMTTSIFPVLASLISLIAYIITSLWMNQSPWAPTIAVLCGTLVALLIWMIVAQALKRFTAVDRANTSSYGYLLNRLYQIQPKLVGLKNDHNNLLQNPSHSIDNCKKEVSSLWDGLVAELTKPSNPTWMAATGYVNVWRCMHYIDEAFIEFEPTEDVLRDALHDEMCIEGSTIENRETLLQKLRVAVTVLDAHAEKYLIKPPEKSPVRNEKSSINSNCPAPTPLLADREEKDARAVIRQVRQELQQFRDDRWENLVRVRNNLLKMTALTGFFLYVLCEVVIISLPSALFLLKAAIIFFLVGALVGLFSRLYNQSKVDTSVDDYQLALARLLAAPLHSGLAALGGVFILEKIGLSSNLGSFDLTPTNIFIAAVFGLTPSLFMNAIQKEAEHYKNDLKSTEAPGGDKAKS